MQEPAGSQNTRGRETMVGNCQHQQAAKWHLDEWLPPWLPRWLLRIRPTGRTRGNGYWNGYATSGNPYLTLSSFLYRRYFLH